MLVKIINDTKPSYRTDNLPERCNEALLKKKVNFESKQICNENLKPNLNRSGVDHLSLYSPSYLLIAKYSHI